MNKICSDCKEKANLNKQYPCIQCSNNEIHNTKQFYEYTTSFGTFKGKLKNYYKPRGY